VVTVIAARRTFTAQLVKSDPADLYGSLRPMPSSRYTQPSCRTTAAVKRADVLRVRKSGDAIRHGDFVPRDP
jgi:hypothetical protein